MLKEWALRAQTGCFKDESGFVKMVDPKIGSPHTTFFLFFFNTTFFPLKIDHQQFKPLPAAHDWDSLKSIQSILCQVMMPLMRCRPRWWFTAARVETATSTACTYETGPPRPVSHVSDVPTMPAVKRFSYTLKASGGWEGPLNTDAGRRNWRNWRNWRTWRTWRNWRNEGTGTNMNTSEKKRL